MEEVDVLLKRFLIWEFRLAHPACPLERWKWAFSRKNLRCAILASWRNALAFLANMSAASMQAGGP